METQILNEFKKAKEEFDKQKRHENVGILKLVVQTINSLVQGKEGKGFLSWNQQELIEKEMILAAATRKIGILKAENESKIEWIKNELKSQESEIRKQLLANDSKSTLKDLEMEIAKVQKEANQQIILLKNEATNLGAYINAIEAINLALTHRINHLRDLSKSTQS